MKYELKKMWISCKSIYKCNTIFKLSKIIENKIYTYRLTSNISILRSKFTAKAVSG